MKKSDLGDLLDFLFLGCANPRKINPERFHIIILALDILSIIPLDGIYKHLIVGSSIQMALGNHMKIYRSLRLRVLLRLYRIPLFFTDVTETMGVNEVFSVFASHLILITIFTHILAIIWYIMGCYHCNADNWTYIIGKS